MGHQVKCDSCETEFPTSAYLKVRPDGTYCCWRTVEEGGKPECMPNGEFWNRPMSTMRFTWIQLYYVAEYIDGNRDLEVLMAVDSIKESIDKILLNQLKSVIKAEDSDGIQKSDSESLDEGDGES